MFIHFNSDKGVVCDNCGTTSTIMHMSIEHFERSLHLCIGCFRTLAQVIVQASKKLRITPQASAVRFQAS
jgi:hypothetical protein